MAAVAAGPLGLPWEPAGVSAHSGLVAAVPTSDTSAGEILLVFSEPLEARASGVDVVDSMGAVVAAAVARPDPTDRRLLRVDLGAIPAGRTDLLVRWWALSAADGHVASGSFAVPGPSGASATAGPEARGHSGAHLSLEVLARVMAFGGLLVALGLLPFGRLVVRPTLGMVPRGMAMAQVGSLVVAAVGGTLLLAVTLLELAAAGVPVDLSAFVRGDHVEVRLALRAVLPLAGGVSAALLLRTGALDRAATLAAAAALLTLGVAAASGHAAAYASPIPAAVDLAHLVAASVWLAGLVGFAGMIEGPTPPSQDAIRAMVPRFSGLALGATALLGLTGLYAAWLHTQDFTSAAQPYSLALALKVVIVGAAFALGAANYADGGRGLVVAGRRLRVAGVISRRLVLEAGMAVTVVVATASLTSTDPPALTRPSAIASVGAAGPVSLSLAPARAGPNLVVVGGPVPVGATMALARAGGTAAGDGAGPDPLALGPLDGLAGTGAERSREVAGPHLAATASIPAGSWEATVSVRQGGTVIARFAFAVDAEGVTAGLKAPAVPPLLLSGTLLLLLGLLAGAGAAVGWALPRVDATVGRISLAAVAAMAGPLGAAIVAFGPPT
jgi:copper transport protein